jgi:phosphatidylserine synthase
MFMCAIVNFHPVPLAIRESGFLVAVAMLLVSLCMVSTLPYPNFIKAFIGQRINIRTALVVAVSLFGVLFYARYFMLLYFGLNVLSGPTVALVRLLKKHPRKKTEPKVIPS